MQAVWQYVLPALGVAEPAGQGTQRLPLVLANVPAAQSVQLEADDGLLLPGGQFEQDVQAPAEQMVPELQGWHAVAPAPLHTPGPQATHPKAAEVAPIVAP